VQQPFIGDVGKFLEDVMYRKLLIPSGRITVGPEGAWPTRKTWRPPRNICS